MADQTYNRDKITTWINQDEITAWINEADTPHERERRKNLMYGFRYGMGQRADLLKAIRAAEREQSATRHVGRNLLMTGVVLLLLLIAMLMLSGCFVPTAPATPCIPGHPQYQVDTLYTYPVVVMEAHCGEPKVRGSHD